MITGASKPTIVPFATSHCTGRVVEDAREALAPLWQAARPEDWPALELVKESTVRRILAGTMPGGLQVHVKLFRPARWSDRARDALGGARAAREFDKLEEAGRRGLAAVRPLLAGTFTGTLGSRSFLVTETASDAQPLPPYPLPPTVAAALGEFLRTAHDRGLHAPDLHRGNVILAGGSPWLLDLTGARFASPLEDDERAQALGFFFQDLDGGPADPAARPVLAAYARGERGDPRFDRLFADAARRGRRVRSRALSAFGRRAFRKCRHTAIEREGQGGVRWFLHRPTAAAWEAARSFAADRQGNELKSGRRGGVWTLDGLVLKDRQSGAARKLWAASYLLLRAGVPIARPVLLRLAPGRGRVVVEKVGEKTLAEELREGALGGAELLDAASRLGRSVGRLHGHGLRNRDLKLCNLVRDDAGEVRVVDLDGIRRKAPVDGRGEGADLGRLLAAWEDGGRPGGDRVLTAFLSGYLRARKRLGPIRDLRYQLRLAQKRACEWREEHRG